jgi:c(7)-type cytochrome triheme protein
MMRTKVKTALMISVAAVLMISLASDRARGHFDLPGTLPPEEFGNILINRTSDQSGVRPAMFSHWSHRQRFTCRVCHFELEFNMLVNTTQITEKMNAAGKFCGTSGCHDGKAAFGHDELHCKNCHNDDLGYGGEKFPLVKNKLPQTKFGNGIDWVKALDDGKIKPVAYLTIKPPPDVAVIKPMLLEAEWGMIPPAIFSHKKHVRWLDCNNCHPDIFNIKKKTTKHFSMARILKREFCGVCHLTVAFPMNDCKQCHPRGPDLKE